MPLNLAAFEEGVQNYWTEIDRRSPQVQAREHAFANLAVAYLTRNPPYFNRAELKRIMEWKHTDARWFNRAMEGINAASDERIVHVTANVPYDPKLAVQRFHGAFHGVGVASVSAILTAARP